MKIAICISGLIGSTSKGGVGKVINFYKTKEYFDKNLIFENAKVDYFLHCWNKELSDDLIGLYKPKKYIFEPPLKKENKYSFKEYGIVSNQYSKLKVVKLKKEYEIKNDFIYDLVILTRFDLLILKEIHFQSLDLKKFYVIGPKYHHSKSCKCSFCNENNSEHGLNDIFFFSPSKKMDLFSEAYNYLDKYTLKSNHIITKKHLVKINMYDDLGYVLDCVTNLYPSIWRFLEYIKLFPTGLMPARIYECDTPLIRWVDKSKWLKFLDFVIFNSRIDVFYEIINNAFELIFKKKNNN